MNVQEKFEQAAQVADSLSSAGNQARYRDINEILEALSRRRFSFDSVSCNAV